MYSITFESLADGQKINTWEDWRLIPSAPPMVDPPEVYTNYVDIPGRKDGPLDLTEVLSDGPTFQNTEGTWTLIWSPKYCEDMTRVQAFDTVTQFLHGKRFRITMDENQEKSYIGRIQVGACEVGKMYSTIPINYIIQPTNTNPLDVDGSNYTSNTGELPWYSGSIVPTNSGSSGGSGESSGGGSSSETPSTNTSQYNSGWNAAIASAGTSNVYYRTEGGTLSNGVLTNAVEVRLYDNRPATKTGTTDYDKGWNDAVAKFSRVYAYSGTPSGQEDDNSITVTGRVWKWKAPATK